MAKKSDLVGQIFGSLIVIKETKGKQGQVAWLCKCECGKERVATANHLKIKSVRSCGCQKYKTGEAHGNRKYDPVTASYRAKASSYKAGAKHRNISWNLSSENTLSLLKNNCFYCGIQPNMKFNVILNREKDRHFDINNIEKQSYILYNGIDRLDSSLGYEEGNVVSCCTKCNFAKNEMSVKEFDEWIEKIYNFRFK